MLVIHGSALCAVEPRDIDVAYTGKWTPSMNATVREWAHAHGIGDLPFDVHRSEGAGGTVVIPSPCGLPTRHVAHVVLEGDPGLVRTRVFRDFSSGLRAHGGTVDDFLGRLAAGEFDGRVSLLPASVRPDYGDQFGTPWDKYCSGLHALRSGVRHAPAWPMICVRLGEGGKLLARLARGEEPTRNWRAAPNTPGGVEGHGDGWSQAVSLQVSAPSEWSVAGREFPDAQAAAEWLGMARPETVPVPRHDLETLLDAARDQTGWVGFEEAIARTEQLLRRDGGETSGWDAAGNPA